MKNIFGNIVRYLNPIMIFVIVTNLLLTASGVWLIPWEYVLLPMYGILFVEVIFLVGIFFGWLKKKRDFKRRAKQWQC